MKYYAQILVEVIADDNESAIESSKELLSIIDSRSLDCFGKRVNYVTRSEGVINSEEIYNWEKN